MANIDITFSYSKLSVVSSGISVTPLHIIDSFKPDTIASKFNTSLLCGNKTITIKSGIIVNPLHIMTYDKFDILKFNNINLTFCGPKGSSTIKQRIIFWR